MILALALTLQSLELLRSWKRIQATWPIYLVKIELPYFPGDRLFAALLWLRLALALSLFAAAPALAVWLLLFITVLTAMRFGGTLNGGSDTMTVVALSSLLVPWGQLYLAVQLTLSYFVAGLVKLRQPQWRNGTALTAFCGLPGWLAWPVVLWECSFPLAWLNHGLCLFYLSTGLVFHLINVRLLGLNRFFWIWLAGYSALWGIQS